MPFKANLGGTEYKERATRNDIHPAVVLSFKFKEGEGTCKTGTTVARDPTDRLLGRYDPDSAESWRHKPFGIVTIETHTTDGETVGNVMIHGAWRKGEALVGSPAKKADQATIDLFREIHIYLID